jgi:hypothetical protein
MSTAQRVLLLTRGAFIGWIAVLVAWAVYVFLLPHRIESEIGSFGAFIVFGLVFSAMYLVNFLIITTPVHFLSLSVAKGRLARRWFQTLFGAGLYLLSVAGWCLAYNTRPDWYDYALAATAGAASAYAVSPSHPMVSN